MAYDRVRRFGFVRHDLDAVGIGFRAEPMYFRPRTSSSLEKIRAEIYLQHEGEDFYGMSLEKL
jgi:hypothetical protein